MKNDCVGLVSTRLCCGGEWYSLSSVPPLPFNQRSMLVCLHLPRVYARESYFDYLAKDMRGIPLDAEIQGVGEGGGMFGCGGDGGALKG